MSKNSMSLSLTIFKIIVKFCIYTNNRRIALDVHEIASNKLLSAF